MSHVFVSSSSKDKHIAEAICSALEKDGVKCWIAPRDILPGIEWGEAIVQAIKQSRVIVLIFSANSNRSNQVKREVERAVHWEVPIVVFRVVDVEPTGSLEYYLSTHQWLDALTAPPEPHLQKLAAAVRALLKEREQGPPVTTATELKNIAEYIPKTSEYTTVPNPPRKSPWLKIALISAAVVGVGFIGLILLVVALSSLAPDPNNTDSNYSSNINAPFKNTAVNANTVVNKTGPAVTINNVTSVHDVFDGGKKGMRITTDVAAGGYIGKELRVALYFFYDNGTALKSRDLNYATTVREVATHRDFVVSNPSSEQVAIFMPYDELEMAPGTWNLQFNAAVWDGNTHLVASQFYPFTLNQLGSGNTDKK